MKVTQRRAPRTEVGLVLYPGCQAAMFHGMTDLLQTAGQIAVARKGLPLRISHWSADAAGRLARSYDSHPGAEGGPDILVVPGRMSGPLIAAEAAPFADWLRQKHADGAVLASSCGGAFLLAETGLLARRPATTHWAFAEQFSMRYPSVKLDTARILIDDGDILTAGGLMAWTDLGLRLVERIYGGGVMAQTSRYFLVDIAGRQQAQYRSFAPRLMHGDEAILRVQHWLQAKGGRAVTVADMACRALLEERTFLRRFKAATGMKPTEYTQHLRMEKARELLQFTRRPVEQVAWTVGYEDPTAFRRLFQRLIGLSPGEYRRRFAAGEASNETRLKSA